MLPTTSNVIATRPIHLLTEKLEIFEKEFNLKVDWPLQVIIVGGGIAGVEIAFTLQTRLSTLHKGGIEVTYPINRYHIFFKVTLITSTNKLLAELGSWVSSKIVDTLQLKNIKLLLGSTVIKVEDDVLHIEKEKNVSQLKYDLLIWSTGAAPVPMLSKIDLERDQDGWILVKPTMQTLSSPFVFAVGDCCSIQGYSYVTKAGVIRNIIAMLKNRYMQ
jgi:NADH dehydrogenase FAD-containing subunit